MRFLALPTDIVRPLQDGGPDSHGHPAERTVSDGEGNPCRHCLSEIAEGDPMLVLAHRPFRTLQPYAESGPIFLCARDCERHPESSALPPMFATWPVLLARGYSAEERIVYGSGGVRAVPDLVEALETMFGDSRIAFAHLRSASNNCYQCRAER